MSLTKLSLAGNNLIIPWPERVSVSDIPAAGTGKSPTFFDSVLVSSLICKKGNVKDSATLP